MMKFRAQFYISIAILVSFGSGYLLARSLRGKSRYLTAIEFLHRLRTFPAGKLKAAGTYYIQLPDGQGVMNLDIDLEPRSGMVRDVSLTVKHVLFSYKALSKYGVPVALLSTGDDVMKQTTWVDIGLRGRFAEEFGPGVKLYRRIQGKWLSLFRRMRPTRGTEFYYKGGLYGFDETTGDWEPVIAKKP